MRTVEILVTCPSCSHTHAVEVSEREFVQPNGPTERLFKLDDIEEILGLSRVTLKRKIYSGELKATKQSDEHNSPWYVSESELKRYRKERERKRQLSLASRRTG